jgi:hypothetical protein
MMVIEGYIRKLVALVLVTRVGAAKVSHQCYYLLKKGHAFNIILLILSQIHEVPRHTGTLVLIGPYGLLTAYQCILNAKNYFPYAYEQKEIVIKVATLTPGVTVADTVHLQYPLQYLYSGAYSTNLIR